MKKTTAYREQQQQRREIFSAELTKQLHEHRMSQAQLANATGIPPDQISRYCSGVSMPGPKNQNLIADALDWQAQYHAGEYFKINSAADNRVNLEIRRTVSMEQASKIMKILEQQGAAA